MFMKRIIVNEKYGKIEYFESLWTGKKEIKINDELLKKVDKNIYSYKYQDKNIAATLKGNYLTGSSMVLGNEKIEIFPKTKWYEWILAFLPFLFAIIWGNSVALVKIFPIVGGAIGGGVSGLLSSLGLILIKSAKEWWIKLILAFAMFVAVFVSCYLIAYLILSL